MDFCHHFFLIISKSLNRVYDFDSKHNLLDGKVMGKNPGLFDLFKYLNVAVDRFKGFWFK